MNKIDHAGMYDLTEEQYHGDCCGTPSLSSSGAVQLIDECPAIYWYNSYLNPDRPVEAPAKDADFGTAAHLLILEPERFQDRVVTVLKDDWRTKEAQETRNTARIAGRVALLAKDVERAKAVAAAVRAHPVAAKAFTGGLTEKSLLWRDAGSGVWCKSRPDYLRETQLVQYKTVPCAHPRAFERHAYDMGYYQRAAWELEACEKVLKRLSMSYFFVAQEREPPYLVSVCELADRAIEWGHMKNTKARAIFAECAAKNKWPGYPPWSKISIPSYAEFQLEERRVAGEFEIGMAG